MSDTFLQHSYLCHYGILGMKWGVRRYQNSNGSLTSAGKQRYSSKKGLKKAKRLTDSDVTTKKLKKFEKTGKAKPLAKYSDTIEQMKKVIKKQVNEFGKEKVTSIKFADGKLNENTSNAKKAITNALMELSELQIANQQLMMQQHLYQHQSFMQSHHQQLMMQQHLYQPGIYLH